MRSFFFKFLLIGFFFRSITACEQFKDSAHSTSNEFNTILEFQNKSRNFGNIYMNDTISTTFRFLNNGNKPLVIHYVQTSCGCTVSDWPTSQIMPKDFGEIKVLFDPTNQLGAFSKDINVFYNGLESPKRVTITGNVKPEKK